MNKLLYVSSSIAFAIAFLPISVHSTSIPDRGPIPFSAYDTNSDESISEKEFMEVRAERMSKRADEGRPMQGAASAPSFSEFDTNKSGTLTRDELAVGQKKQKEKRRAMGQGQGMGKGAGTGKNMPTFSDYDLDGDDKILEKEFNEARSNRINERARQGYQMRNLDHAPSFSDIDVDKDGQINIEEFTAHQIQRRQQSTQ